MPTATTLPAYADSDLLFCGQIDTKILGTALVHRFTPVISTLIFRARSESHRDYRDDVLGEVFRMVFDPQVKRFSPERGSPVQYLSGLVRNAVQIVDRQYRPVCVVRPDSSPGVNDALCRRDAATVYFNTDRSGVVPGPEGPADARDVISKFVSTLDSETNLAVRLHFIEGLPVTQIAARLKINRFAISRRLNGFRLRAAHRLALAGAA